MLENNKIKIPKDLYSIDTLYLVDRYPELRKGKAKEYHATIEMKGSNYMIADNDPGKTLISYSSPSDEIKVKSGSFTMDKQRPSASFR